MGEGPKQLSRFRERSIALTNNLSDFSAELSTSFMSQLHVTGVGKWHLEHGFDVVNTFQRRVTTLCCR